MRRAVAAHAAEELDGTRSVQREPNVFDHLPVTHLDDEEDACTGCELSEMSRWERIERDGAQHADFDSFGAGFGGDGLEDAADDAIADEDDLGVFGSAFFGARLALLGAAILCLEIADVGFELVGIEMQRGNEVVAGRGGAGDGPPRSVWSDGNARELDRLHHLTDEAIGKEDDGIAVAIGKIES